MSESNVFWDKQADKYSKSPIADQAAYERKLKETQSLFLPGMRVLEFGCGTGTTALHHASHVAHIDAIDISENMVAIARQKAQNAGVKNIHFKRCTLTEFEAKPASYEAILGLSILHLLPNRAESLARVHQLLKPDGVFVSSTACLGDTHIRHIKLVAPLLKRLGLMPDVSVLKEKSLVDEINSTGLNVDQHWNHGDKVKIAFIVSSKPE